VAYATVDELAQALRSRVTDDNRDLLQACLDAAAIEIDHAVDRDDPIEGDDLTLANRINVARAVEWFKSNDAVFGALSFEAVGVLRAPTDQFGRWALTLTPLQQHWAIA
jgi:hypothetical protein